MYIKEIRINGFKSFAEKVNIELKKSFTGIVGPNGSGKSNIVDAIKWVLGEQSVKSLRGSNNMTDVIFSGSASRNPSSYASVSIVFDNNDRALNIDYNEVSIKRTLYKTGENDYYINNEKCRLKDVQSLLIDSMSSKESFNIIPQNKVDEILSSSPEARRVIFEDASGVLKYKKRKEESLRKLDRTHENIDRVDMIINELNESIVPLERASIKAREYKSALSELENVEIALIAKDITTFSVLADEAKKEKAKKEDELNEKGKFYSSDNARLEKIKLEILKADEKINSLNNAIFKNNETLIDLSNKKALMSERNKYDKNSDEVQKTLLLLKDKEGVLKNSIKSFVFEINNLKDHIASLTSKRDSFKDDINNLNEKSRVLDEEINKNIRREAELKNKIDVLNANINNMARVPYSVKNVLNNPSLNGIYDIIGNIISADEKYSVMLDVALGFSSNNIITENEESAKEAIDYLKRQGAGRATFYPLNVIKAKFIDTNTLKEAENMEGYLGIASDLVNYDNKFNNIVLNVLGNIIVAKDINSAINISKKTNYKYRVVSLEGDILHVGGSLTGGSQKQNSSAVTDKYELEKTKINYETIIRNLNEQDNNKKDILGEINTLSSKLYDCNLEIAKNEESVKEKGRILEEKNREYNELFDEINALDNNSLKNDSVLSGIIDDYYKCEETKLKYEKELEYYKGVKSDLNSSLIDLEESIKRINNENNSLISSINNLEIEITKYNINLDNLLNRLSEDYSLGYERAKSEYVLEIPEEEAREKVFMLRRKLKSLGEVNLGSIEEYERISVRYNFLNKQKEDLLNSEKDLLSIINEMDEVMKDRFTEAFEKINIEFGKVFKSLFKGGSAYLKMTDPSNVLETGIEIVAVPSGKSMKPLSLLSGGERTMTAISLLFSIMNIKNVPFVIFDEVESALDEANATIFGEYLSNYRDKTQLLIITHNKKTMEFVDLLYGVTMQESGVSKLVSVKLEDANV